MKRDPRLPRIKGGLFGLRSDAMLDRISTASPFFRTGTHRAPHANSVLNQVFQFDLLKFKALKSTGRHWKTTPGPGTYRTPFSLNRSHSLDTVNSSRTVVRRSPSAILFGPSPRSLIEVSSAGPFHFSPTCRYTTVCLSSIT